MKRDPDLSEERNFRSRKDPIGGRFLGGTADYTITMKVYVRSAIGQEVPDQRTVENKITSLLLAQPRLDEGAFWDVAATSIPGSGTE